MDNITPEQAIDYAKTHGTVHNDVGQVADLDTARGMADLIDIGKNLPTHEQDTEMIANDLEGRKEKEANEVFLEEMTPTEKTNMAILERLKNKDGVEINTHAFIDKEDEKLRKYRIILPIPYEGEKQYDADLLPNNITFCCKDGFYNMPVSSILGDTTKLVDKIVWGGVGDYLDRAAKGESVGKLNLPTRNEDGQENLTQVSITQYELTSPDTLQKLSKMIKYAEERGAKNIKPELNVDEVLKGLLG